MFLSKIQRNPQTILLLAILGAAFLVRLYNLSYNSPSIDEAIYVMIGRLGLFQNDWWSYNPSTWLAGLPYIYPTIAATTYMLGGIMASRLFNIILSLLLIEAVYNLTLTIIKSKDNLKRHMAAGIAALIAGGASIGIVVSRLATYDIPSYYLFLISLLFLLNAEKKPIKTGRAYFYAGIFLVLASLTKIIIGVYVPFLVVYSFVKARNLGKAHVSFWKKYFILPLVIGFGIYGITNIPALLTYADISSTREKEPFIEIVLSLWKHVQFILPFYLIGTLGLLFTKRIKQWAFFSLLSLLVIIPHFITQRALWTMEKQSFLLISLIAPLIGIGIAEIITRIKFKPLKLFSGAATFVALVAFWIVSFVQTLPYNTLWQDTRPIKPVIETKITKSDKILSESGVPFILDVYDSIYPLNVTTFDYFEYRKMTGNEAYIAAVTDGYFDVIQLNGKDQYSTSANSLRGTVLSSLKDNYRVIFEGEHYVMYRRAY